jgi:hypothetical protein
MLLNMIALATQHDDAYLLEARPPSHTLLRRTRWRQSAHLHLLLC